MRRKRSAVGWGFVVPPATSSSTIRFFSSSSTLPKQVLNKKIRSFSFFFFLQINYLNIVIVLFLFVVIQPTVLRKTIVSDVSLVLFNDAWSRDNQAFPTVWKQPGNSPRVTLHDRKALDFRVRGKWRRNLPSFMFSAFCWQRSLACSLVEERREKEAQDHRPSSKKKIIKKTKQNTVLF